MSEISRSTPLYELLVTETVRQIEESRSRDDSHTMQLAFDRAQSTEHRIVERAKLIAQDFQLSTDIERWKSLVRSTSFMLAVLAILVGMGIATSVTAQYRFINAPYALVLTLGPHLFALLLWLITLARPPLSQGNSVGGTLLGLAGRLPIRRGRYFWTVLHAAIAFYARKGLLPWISGIASHAFWSVILLVVVIALGLAFSFQSYRLSWETTILPSNFFIGFVEASGWLPQQLGFPLPDTATLQNAAAPDSNHRAWAWWLIGCISVYGLLPRLALMLVSWSVWRYRKRRLTLDLALPYYMKLAARFNDMEPTIVLDRERQAERPTAPLTRPALPGEPATLAVIGFELPEDVAWPPKQIQDHTGRIERIAGSNQERQTVLQQLRQHPPYRLLIVCYSVSSPDRGTAHFLREAAAQSVQCALLLLPSESGTADKGGRWRDWLADSGLGEISCFASVEQATLWLKDKDD